MLLYLFACIFLQIDAPLSSFKVCFKLSPKKQVFSAFIILSFHLKRLKVFLFF